MQIRVRVRVRLKVKLGNYLIPLICLQYNHSKCTAVLSLCQHLLQYGPNRGYRSWMKVSVQAYSHWMRMWPAVGGKV